MAAVNEKLLLEQIHKYSGLHQSLFNIEQASRLANTQEKAVLDELKKRLEEIAKNSADTVSKQINEFKNTAMDSEQISNVIGSSLVTIESGQMNSLNQQFPIIGAVFNSIQQRMGQSAILSGGSVAPRAPRPRVPRPRVPRVYAPRPRVPRTPRPSYGGRRRPASGRGRRRPRRTYA